MSEQHFLVRCATASGGAVFLLVCAILSAPARAADDPFGQGTDPFREGNTEIPSGEDPFGTPPKNEEESRKRESALRYLEVLHVCAMAERLLVNMSTSDDPSVFLEATLSRLNETAADPRSTSAVGHLEKLLRFEWPRQDGDAPSEIVARAFDECARSADPRSHPLKGYRGFFRNVVGKPAAFDWQANSSHWRQVFVELLEAGDAEDLPNHIRSRMKSTPLSADLMREIYLAAVRVRQGPWAGEETWDFELVRPWLGETQTFSRRSMLRTAEVLTSLVAAGAPDDHPDRVRLDKQLLAYLANPACSERHVLRDDGLLPRLWKLDRRVGGKVLQVLLTRHGSLGWYFAGVAGIKRQQAEDLLWGHEIRFDGEPVSLQDAISRIGGGRVWVDAETAADNPTITLQITASRMAALESAATASKCEVVHFPHGIVWVGPKSKRTVAEQKLRDALGRVPLGDSPVSTALAENTEIEFIETPLRDVCDYLSDLHSVQVKLPRQVDERPITQQLNNMPLFLALTLLTEAADLRWTTAENMILIGETESIAEFDQLHEWWRRRRIRLRKLELAGSKVAAEMFQPTTLEFIETPLQDVCDYLSDLHSLQFLLLSPADRKRPQTVCLCKHNLGWALTYLLWREGLTWDTDGEIVVIGAKANVARYRKSADTRPQRRAAYPEQLADKLLSTYEVRIQGCPLDYFCEALTTASGITIRPNVDRRGPDHDIEIDTGQYPLDVVLDLISHPHGLTWEIRGNQVVIEPAK